MTHATAFKQIKDWTLAHCGEDFPNLEAWQEVFREMDHYEKNLITPTPPDDAYEQRWNALVDVVVNVMDDPTATSRTVDVLAVFFGMMLAIEEQYGN